MAFGTPQGSGSPFSDYGVGFVNLPQSSTAQAPMAQAVQKPKMNWLGILADALAGAAGRPGPYGAMLDQRNELMLQEQLYQQHQQAEMQRQMQMYDYQRQHPNDETTQLIIQSGIDPNSVQGKAMYAQALQSRINPFTAIDVQQPDGSTQRTYVRPPMAPAAPVGALSDTPPTSAPPPAMGGQTAPAPSGTFPKPKAKRAK